MNLQEREAASILQTYGRVPVTFVRGDGAWLYDEDGRAYLDFLAGIAVVSVGHANTAVAAAVEQHPDSPGLVPDTIFETA